MIVKVERDNCIQKLSNSEKVKHYYSDLKIEGKFIKLPMHIPTMSMEILFLNDGKDDYSKLVSQIFAKVATAGV